MSTTIESLELEVLSSSQSAESGLDALTASLEKLKKATSGGVGLGAVANQIKKISDATNGINGANVGNVTGLAKAIQLLGGTKISSTIATQITAVSTALSGADFTGGKEKLDSLVDALSPLSNLPKSNLASYVNNLKKLPEALNALDDSTISVLTDKIQKLAIALKPLGDEMQKVANGFSAFPAKIQRLIANTNSLTASNNKASTSYVNFYAKIKMAVTAVRTIATKIASCIKSSNEYIENVNLFTVAMGKYAESAKAYAEQVSEIMGIDPSEWMRNQGVFMTLASGFGVASDRAATMSQNLTQLGYDLSSFYNMGVEETMQKLQSGISGELEPLRRLGYDLSQAKLEATALSLGIDKAVSSMTQAEKAELRYYAIMTQVTQTHGDMARTLESPANQLRILKAQLEQAARAIGNIFIPMLNAVLPYVIAFVKVIRILANEIANLFGFEMPEVDYSSLDGVSSGANDASNALDDAAESAKKLQKYTLGIDELNVVDPTAGSGADEALGGGSFDFELPTYDFLADATESRVNQIVQDLKEWLGITEEIDSWAELFDTKLGEILITVGAIGGAFAAWKVAKATQKAITALSKLKGKKLNISFGIIGATTFMADLQKLKDYIDDFTENGASFSNVAGMLSEFAGLVGDAMIMLGNVKLGGALKAVQGIGEIISAVSDMSKEGIDFENITDAIRGMTNLGIAIGLFTGKLQITGIAMTIQGFTDIIHELAENWEAIKEGDWSGVDKAALAISAIEIIGGIATAIIAFKNIKGISEIGKAAKTATEVATVTESVSTTTSTLSTKLTGLVKNLGLGIAIIAEVAAAAALFVGAIWLLGEELKKVDEAWQPVIEHAGTVAIAVGVGTGLLVGIGAATARLGSIGTSLIVNIALGVAMLAEIGAASALFLAEILVVGKLLDEINQAWQPVLDNGEPIAIAIGVGTGLLVGIGVVAALLGVAATATAGALPLAIGLGTAMLLELGVAAALFLAEIIVVGDLLVEVNKAWQPVLDNGENIEKAIATGTTLLIAIGVVSAALGVAAVASVGLLPLAIAAGTGMLLQLADAFGDFCDALSDVSADITNTLAPALTGVNDVLPSVRDEMDDFVEFMIAFAGDMVLYTGSSAIAGIAATIDAFLDFFTVDPIKRLANEIDDQYDDMTSLKQNLKDVIPVIKDVTDLLDEYNVAMDDFEKASGTGGGVIGAILKEVTFGVKVLLEKGWNALPSWLTDIVTNVSTTLTKGWTSLPSFLTSLSTTASTTLTKGWTSLPSFLTSITTTVSTTLKKGWTSLPNWISDIAGTLKIKLPHISVSWIDTGVLGIKYPSFSVSYYAQGGFPDMGQLFIAREAGAELVGNIGGRTAVMNNDQIVESVSTGVYQAVVAALGGNSDEGGDTQIIINLDGEKIYENQQKVARNRGYNLGMGVFSFG